MSVHFLRSSRGAAIAWRQAAEPPPLPPTAKPRRRFQLHARGEPSVLLGQNLSGAAPPSGGSVVSTGSAAVSFSGSGVGAGSVASAGAAVASFSGSGIGAGSVLAAGSSAASFASGNFSAVVPAAGVATVAFSGSAIGAGSMSSTGTSNVEFTSGDARPGTGASAADVWNFVMPNGQTAGQMLTALLQLADDLHRIHGLRVGVPLEVSPTRRAAGAIEQTLAESGSTITATRVS